MLHRTFWCAKYKKKKVKEPGEHTEMIAPLPPPSHPTRPQNFGQKSRSVKRKRPQGSINCDAVAMGNAGPSSSL